MPTSYPQRPTETAALIMLPCRAGPEAATQLACADAPQGCRRHLRVKMYTEAATLTYSFERCAGPGAAAQLARAAGARVCGGHGGAAAAAAGAPGALCGQPAAGGAGCGAAGGHRAGAQVGLWRHWQPEWLIHGARGCAGF